MIGFDRLVELGQRDRHELLVGQSESLQHDHLVLGRQHLEQRELHVGEHEAGVALREQHRARESGGVDGERAGVDHARTGHRVDAEAVPREVCEREPGHDLDVDTHAAQQRNGALGNRGTARYGVQHLAVFVRGFDHPRRDRGVHGVEIVAAVVEQVERLEIESFARELVDGRVSRGAHVAHGDSLQRGARRGQQKVDAGRTEPDDDDSRLGHPPAGTVVVVVVVGAAHAADFSRHVRTAGALGGVTPNVMLPF